MKHDASPAATLIDGALGVILMLALKAIEKRATGPVAMLSAVGIDILTEGPFASASLWPVVSKG